MSHSKIMTKSEIEKGIYKAIEAAKHGKASSDAVIVLMLKDWWIREYGTRKPGEHAADMGHVGYAHPKHEELLVEVADFEKNHDLYLEAKRAGNASMATLYQEKMLKEAHDIIAIIKEETAD